MSVVSIGRYAKPGMGSVNTYWIETARGVIVIDGQRELSSARAARSAIEQTGKPIVAAFLTHPHPDHFGGIGVFAPQGSDVPLYGSAQTADSIRTDRWGLVKASRKVVGNDFPETVRLPDQILADGQPVEIDGPSIVPAEMGGGEAECMTVLHVPSERLLFAGDVIQDRMTAFLLEGRSRAWLAQLHALRERFAGAETVYPGHGEPGPFDDLVNRQIDYLEALRRHVAADGAEAAAAAMTGRYAGYQPVAAIPDLLDQDAKAVANELAAEQSEVAG